MTPPLRARMISLGYRGSLGPQPRPAALAVKCSSGKTDHPDKTAAQQQLISLKRQGHARNMHCYHCTECGQWHVGHQPGSSSKHSRARRGLQPRKVS